ncbi:MAG: nitroreductase family protein [Treponema sp.]|jgi:nitroreductase|nr:nitroreductase family protein [Treponema sp.]
MSAIFERRSVRNFLPKPVEPDKIERILRAGFEAPSAHNRRPWEFLVITGSGDLEALSGMSPYAKLCAKAAAVIAACADLRLGEPKGEDPDLWWTQDLAAATENMLLQLVDEGLGGVWLGWYPNQSRVKAFSERFGLPGHLLPFSLIALGYPAGPPQKQSRFEPAKVHYEYYGRSGR